MNKLYYILVLLIFITSCVRETNISEQKSVKAKDTAKFQNNKIFPRTYSDDNYIDLELQSTIEDGNYIGLFNDSTIAFTGKFKEGKPEGLFHFYYLSGKLRHTSVYENGLENGPFTYWTESGTLEECGSSKNDTTDGFHYGWHNYNTLRFKILFVNGKQEGREYYYFENGIIESICDYKNGKFDGEWKIFYENGAIKEMGQHKEGYAVGTWKEQYKDGKIKSLKYYTDLIGNKEKIKIKRYENTMAESHLSFPINTWVEYDSIGNVIFRTYHDNSFNIILENEFYPSGKLHFKTYYKGEVPYMCSRNPGHRIRNGYAEEYYENGKFKIKGYYIDDERNGEWKFFDIKGNIIKTEKYRNDSLIIQ